MTSWARPAWLPGQVPALAIPLCVRAIRCHPQGFHDLSGPQKNEALALQQQARPPELLLLAVGVKKLINTISSGMVLPAGTVRACAAAFFELRVDCISALKAGAFHNAILAVPVHRGCCRVRR